MISPLKCATSSIYNATNIVFWWCQFRNTLHLTFDGWISQTFDNDSLNCFLKFRLASFYRILPAFTFTSASNHTIVLNGIFWWYSFVEETVMMIFGSARYMKMLWKMLSIRGDGIANLAKTAADRCQKMARFMLLSWDISSQCRSPPSRCAARRMSCRDQPQKPPSQFVFTPANRCTNI